MNTKRLKYIYNRLNELNYNDVLFTPVKMKYSRDYYNYYGIWLSQCKQFIKYNSYGTGAFKNTLDNLQWIIKNIYKNDTMKEVNLWDE
jgi:hypothetical protein